LELGEHGLDRNDQNAPTTAAFDELGEKNAAFDGFSESDGIGDEESLAGLGKSEESWVELIGEHVHGSAVAEVENAVLWDGGADLGFQHKAGLRIMRTGVADRFGIPGIHDGDFTIFPLDGVNESGLLAFDQSGQPDDSQNCGPGGGPVDASDQPFLVAD
jgi:hypothetical protein